MYKEIAGKELGYIHMLNENKAAIIRWYEKMRKFTNENGYNKNIL